MIALVLAAAGTGSRFGSDTPKQFTHFQGRPLYLCALERFATFVDQAVIVLPEQWKAEVEGHIQALPYRDRLLLEVGGPRRQDSVLQGLRRLSDEVQMVLIHDAVRPFASAELISRIIEGTRQHGACIPVLPLADTIKEIRQGRVVHTLDRQDLSLVQTPQGFEIDLIKKAFAQAEERGLCATDEATLVEQLGSTVYAVAGERSNIKVTWKEDLIDQP